MNLGKQPITESHPCGRGVRDEPAFDLLQYEISKLSNPFPGGPPDWEVVVRESSSLLKGTGKDVLVACYLAAGLLFTRDLEGLVRGIQVLADMFEKWWEQLHPSVARIRARSNAVEWLVERISAHGEEHDWSGWPAQPPTLVEQFLVALDSIDIAFRGMGDQAPSLQPVRSLVRALAIVEIEPVQLAENPTEVASLEIVDHTVSDRPNISTPVLLSIADNTIVQPARVLSDLGSVSLDSTDEAKSLIGEALERLAYIGAWYVDADRSNAMGFRLRRVAAWTATEQPPGRAASETDLPAPIEPLQNALSTLVSNKAYSDIVNFSEVQLPEHPFWLDLNCICAEALVGLGDEFADPHREVCNETRKFVDRLTGIEGMKFSNGMPFASAVTQKWLQAISLRQESRASSSSPDILEQVIATAVGMAASDDLASAASCLQRAIEQSSSVGSRLRLRTTLCDLLLRYRRGTQIDSFARALITEIDRYGAEVWEPAITAEALRTAYDILARNDENMTESNALLVRLAILDGAVAVQMIS